MYEMDELLRRDIAEHYDCSCWENVTGIIWENGTPWQLIKFERDVEYYGTMWRCLIITKLVYDPDDIPGVDDSEDVFSSAFELCHIDGSRYNHQ